MISSVVYAETSNCLMYLSPTTVSIQNNCLSTCLIPMLVVIITEYRIFAYVILIQERLRIINEVIKTMREKLKNSTNDNVIIGKGGKEEEVFIITDKLFFINEFMHLTTKIPSSFPVKMKKNERIILNFLKKFFDFRTQDTKVHCHDINSINYVEHIIIIKSIYSKLYEISDILNVTYGMQIISIIAVQFITLTTLLYNFSMKLVR